MPSPSGPAAPPRILIVEDEVIIAAALEARLRALGYQVVGRARTGLQAIALAEELLPDVILLDIRLDEREGAVDGVDVAEWLRDNLSLPVVFTTAYADTATVNRARAVDAYGYLIKPYDDTVLRTTLELALYRHRAEAQRRALEHQLRESQKLEVVGRFASSIAHDFNNLLTVIYSSTELMALLPHEHAALLAEIQGAVQRGAALSRRLLLFSRRTAGNPRDIELRASLSELMPLLRRLVGDDVRLHAALDGPLHARMDPVQLDQIVMNLVVNARDAMPAGGSLHLSLRAASHEELPVALQHSPFAAFARLDVRDSGVGIAPDMVGRIFEPFFTTKQDGRGTGLGLSILRSILDELGGDVAVSSVIGRGSTFHVWIPALSEPPVHSAASTEDAAAADRGQITVLLVDDDALVRQTLQSMLSLSGYTVLAADGPGQALSILQSGLPRLDLLLTDVSMPYMRGPDLAETLRRTLPQLRVGYLSGLPAADIPPELVLLKPFDRAALLRFVAECLQPE